MPEAPITTTGEILAILSPGTYRVVVPNGKELIAHLPRKTELSPEQITIDTKVHLEFTPYDMEKARIARIVSGE